MKNRKFVSIVLFLTMMLPSASFAASSVVHIPFNKEKGFEASPNQTVSVELDPGQAQIVLWSGNVNVCVITQGDAEKLGTNLFELARVLSPKNQADSALVTCQDPARPYDPATLTEINF